jgi:hypothetical protein
MSTTKVFYPDGQGSAVGGSPAACCMEKDQIQFSNYVLPQAALPSTFLQSSNSLDITFIIPPGCGVHLVDQMFLEMQLTNTTGSTGMNLVNSGLLFQYHSALINNSVVATNWMQGEMNLWKISTPPEVQYPGNISLGISNSTYQDNLFIPPTGTIYTRVPLRNIFVEQKLPLWLPNMSCSVVIRVLGGQSLINDAYSLITNLSVNGANVKLLLQGIQMTDGARAAYTKRLMGVDQKGSTEKIYRYSEVQQFQFGTPTISSGSPLQLTMSSVGNCIGGFPMLIPVAPQGAQYSYSTIPITAIDLINGGSSVNSSLGTYSNFTSYILLENMKYIPNNIPMSLNNLYFISYSRDPMKDIHEGSQYGSVYTNGVNLSWQVVPGANQTVPMIFYFFGYFKSQLRIDFTKGLFLAERWTA